MGTLTTLSGGTISRNAGVEYSEEPSMFTVYPAFLLEGLESSIILVMSSPRVHWKRIVDCGEREEQGDERISVRGRSRERKETRKRGRRGRTVGRGRWTGAGTREGSGGKEAGTAGRGVLK
jgi:hypothetical protein